MGHLGSNLNVTTFYLVTGGFLEGGNRREAGISLLHLIGLSISDGIVAEYHSIFGFLSAPTRIRVGVTCPCRIVVKILIFDT